MDDKLGFLLEALLEADEQGSADIIKKQLPKIQALINKDSKIKIDVSLNDNVQSQIVKQSEQLGKQVSQTIQTQINNAPIKVDMSSLVNAQKEITQTFKKMGELQGYSQTKVSFGTVFDDTGIERLNTVNVENFNQATQETVKQMYRLNTASGVLEESNNRYIQDFVKLESVQRKETEALKQQKVAVDDLFNNLSMLETDSKIKGFDLKIPDNQEKINQIINVDSSSIDSVERAKEAYKGLKQSYDLFVKTQSFQNKLTKETETLEKQEKTFKNNTTTAKLYADKIEILSNRFTKLKEAFQNAGVSVDIPEIKGTDKYNESIEIINDKDFNRLHEVNNYIKEIESEYRKLNVQLQAKQPNNALDNLNERLSNVFAPNRRP